MSRLADELTDYDQAALSSLMGTGRMLQHLTPDAARYVREWNASVRRKLTIKQVLAEMQERERQATIDADTPGRVHADAGDTETLAAQAILPRSGTWRRRVYDEIERSGDEGRTDWEIHEALGGLLYTIAPRRGELLRQGLIRDSGMRRKTNNKKRAIAWVVAR